MKTSETSFVTVWDLPTRVFHWTLVGLVLFLVISAEVGGQLMRWHILSGCLLSGLILFRFMWGFWGSYHARFIHFVRSPKVVFFYLCDLFQGKMISYSGHNPAGAIMVVVLLIALAIQSLSGLVTSDDVLWSGQFYHWVPDNIAELGRTIHHLVESAIKILVLVHILAVFVHQFYFKEPLIGAMIHGRKKLTSHQLRPIHIHHKTLMAVCVIAALWVGWLWSLPI